MFNEDQELERKIESSPSAYFAEARQMKEMISWVWQELISQRGKKLAKKMIIIMAVSSFLGILTPIVFGRIFEILNPGSNKMGSIVTWIAVLLLIMTAREIMRVLHSRTREVLAAENIDRLNLRTNQLFFEKSLGTHTNEKNNLSEANVKRGYERVLDMQMILQFDGVEAILNLIIPFVCLWIFGLYYSITRSTLSYLVIGGLATLILVTFLLWTFFLNRKVLRVGLPIDKMWRYLNRYRVERWSHVERVKTSGKEKEETETMKSLFDKAIVPDRKLWFWFIDRTGFRSQTTNIIFCAMIIYCAYQVQQGQLIRGCLWFLISWSNQFVDNLWQIGHLEHLINFFTPSIMSMKEALTLPIGISIPENPIELNLDIEPVIRFENVSYDYTGQKSTGEDDEDPVVTLSDITFSIYPGDKIALIGPSGAGKTTVMRLALRCMDPTSGRITINGIDLREIDLHSWLSMIGYVPQKSEPFSDTFKYNLTYGLAPEDREKMDDEEIWQLAKKLEIDFADRLTEGLETQIGERGIKLSGGQNQRLMVGAAAIKNPKIMIIDEATSSLDATTEKKVQHGLEQLLENRSALIVTHRLSTVRRICNQFIMIERVDGSGGKIVAMANSFEELAEKSETFRDLARDQGIVL